MTLSLSVCFAVLFITITSAAIIHFELDMWLIAFYPALSLVTFIFYGVDKRAAIKGRERVAERTLHLMSLTGGWPGALLAQQAFRHKSLKQPFKAILWLTILINIAIFVWGFWMYIK